MYSPSPSAGEHVELSLGDWPAADRVRVIAQLRKLSKTDLACDTNLDAFISHLRTPKVNEAAAAHKAQAELLDQLTAQFEKTRTTFTPQDYFGRLRAIDKFQDALTQWELSYYRQHVLGNELTLSLNTMAKQLGLPPVKVTTYVGSGGSHDYRNVHMEIGVAPRVDNLQPETIGTVAHEFLHHQQGMCHSPEVRITCCEIQARSAKRIAADASAHSH